MSGEAQKESVAFTPERLDAFKKLVAKYERPQSALLPVLYLAQEQFGYLSMPVMVYVAKLLEIPPGKVIDAVSFYTMFKTKDPGKFCFQICHNVTCTMMGAKEVIKVVKEELGVAAHHTTEDGRLSFETVECLGSCDRAPSIQCNNEFLKPMDGESFRGVLRKLKSGEEKIPDEVYL